MTTPSHKETSTQKETTSLPLQPPPITLTSNAKDTKEEDLDLFDPNRTFNIPSDNDDTLTELYKELNQLDEKEKKTKDSSITETEFHNIQRLIRKKRREVKII